MTIDELYRYIKNAGPLSSRVGNTITVARDLDLGNLGSRTKLPEGVTLLSGGNLNLRKLTTLPAGVTLSSGGSLYLGKLTTLSPGVSISAGHYLDLGSLTTLPEGAEIWAAGSLSLHSLTALPASVTLTAEGYLDLNGLITLPEGVTLSAGGGLYLNSLTTLPESVTLSARELCYGNFSGPYRGLTLASYDGIVSELVGEPKMVGEYSIQRANYFLSSGRGLRRTHYIAVRGEHAAHGSTVREAVEDCEKKVLKVKADEATIAAIKASGTVTLAQYRAITGACREGCRQWAASNGLDGREEIAVEELRPMLAGVYGSVEFLGAIA